VVVFPDGQFDYIIIEKDTSGRVWLTADPHFHLPPVTVQVRAFTLIMEQPVTCIELHLLIDRDIHPMILAMEDIILL